MDKVYKAFSDETRREIVRMLLDEPLTAGEIGSHFDIALPSLTHHLNILSNSEIIGAQRVGRNILYALNKNRLQEFLLSAYKDFSS